MKIYDKKKFWGTIIFFGGFTLLEIFITYIKLGIVRYEPSLFITICAITYMMEAVSEEIGSTTENVLPLRLQEKYFDLPSQKPGNRPLWG